MVEVDTSQLEHAEALLMGIPGATKKAVSTALRKSLKGAKQDVTKKVIGY